MQWGISLRLLKCNNQVRNDSVLQDGNHRRSLLSQSDAEAGLNGLQDQIFSYQSWWGCHLPKALWLLCRLDKSACLCRAYILEYLLNVICKSTLIHASICPNIPSISILFISFICANIDISINFSRFPATLTLSYSFLELSLVARTISP